MDGTKRSKPARGSQSQKTVLSSDCRLQLACMKSELLVIADQHAAVNTFPGLVHTARHTTRVYTTRSRWGNPQGSKPPKVGWMFGVTSSTASRIGRCSWMICFLWRL